MSRNLKTPLSTGESGEDLARYIDNLSQRHDLQLDQLLPGGESPSKFRARTGEKKASIVQWIRYLWYKAREELKEFVLEFDHAAHTTRQGWVAKPNADRDLLPKSQAHKVLITKSERAQLLELLFGQLDTIQTQVKQRVQQRTMGSKSRSEGDVLGNLTTARPQTRLQHFSEPFPINPFLRPTLQKRKSDSFEDLQAAFGNGSHGGTEFKKPCVRTIGELPVKTVRYLSGTSGLMPAPARGTAFKLQSDSLATKVFETQTHKSLDHKQRPNLGGPSYRSANTSFGSNAPSVFSTNTASMSFTSQSSVSTAAYEIEMHEHERSLPSTDTRTNSGGILATGDAKESHFQHEFTSTEGCSGRDDCFRFTERVNDSLLAYAVDDDLDLCAKLHSRLEQVFPTMPPSMQKLAFHVRYEMARVFLHAEVCLQDVKFPECAHFDDLDKLWEFLEACPQLLDKELPDRSPIEAWKSCLLGDYFVDGKVVVFSGKLLFSDSPLGPLFHLRLAPLKLDKSHRLGRRFGHHRFLELAIPALVGTRLPRILLNKDNTANVAAKHCLLEWLSTSTHSLLGRQWGVFYGKNAATRTKGNGSLLERQEDDNKVYKLSHRLYLFATGSIGFQEASQLPSVGESATQPTCMSISSLIHWLIQPCNNSHQPFLKLYARIALGLSKTDPTIVFPSSKMVFRRADVLSDYDHVMNDGCGRISMTAAREIATSLGIRMYEKVPTAIQARIGGAKGIWLVDPTLQEGVIEIYPSQTKWHIAKSGKRKDIDEAHRTFEVCKHSQNPKSAALNLQILPILIEQAKDEAKMTAVIEKKLEDNLNFAISGIAAAMTTPEALRSWTRNNNAGLGDRVKNGKVAFNAGMPTAIDERINLMLEAGFDPNRQGYLQDRIWDLYSRFCSTLQDRINIVVGQSCYVFCVPDFTGTLAEGEVHLGFSQPFIDEQSCFNDDHVEGPGLVTRSPAHTGSDIQKINFVSRAELQKYKDVAIFSTKGMHPLAGKLSGGDYDGDTVWCCWDSTIVESFCNAPDPMFPDLVAKGYLSKDESTYAEIAESSATPVATFLRKSLEFNLESSRLGFATVFKEKVAYTLNSVNHPKLITFTALLSCLVDQYKQGYSMTDEQWQNFLAEEVDIPYLQFPAYKEDEPPRQITHIIDRLKFVTAKNAIEQTKTDLHNKWRGHGGIYDEDLIQRSRAAKSLAKDCPELATIIKHLVKDITGVQEYYQHLCQMGKAKPVAKNEEAAFSNWPDVLATSYKKWKDIKPATTGPFSAFLIQAENPGGEYTNWELLKASFAAQLDRGIGKSFMWWMAGKQLCHLKAERCSASSRSIIEPIYCCLKPDPTVIKRRAIAAEKARTLDVDAERLLSQAAVFSGDELTDDNDE